MFALESPNSIYIYHFLSFSLSEVETEACRIDLVIFKNDKFF